MEQRKILFERTLAGSYMKLETEGESYFDEQMLQKQKLPGLLSMKKCYLDGGVWYWFDISGKQALDTFCRIKPLGESFLKQMLCSVCSQMEILEQHLIRDNCLQLEPELIYIVNSSQEIVFTALPGAKEELTQGFSGLMEYLLTKIDHKDTKAVRLAYEIYEMTLQEGYRIRDVRDAIFSVSESGESIGGAGKEERQEEPDSIPSADYGQVQEIREKPARPIVTREKKEKRPGIGTESRGKSKQIFSRMIKIWEDWKEKLKSDQGREEEWHIVHPEDDFEEEIHPNAHEQIHPTICLTDYREHPEGLLLYEGYEHFDNIRLGEKDMQVGQGDDSDIKIAKDTISRIHARIECREKEYYLEDLNSTNGTFVNEEQLSYKQAKQLKTNDIVRFADVKYRFV